MKPEQLVLRCYGCKRSDKWFGVCLDLNLAAESSSLKDLKTKLKSMIYSYLETVLDTEDKESIPYLLQRKAPVADWLRYYLILACGRIRNFPDGMIFDVILPFQQIVTKTKGPEIKNIFL